MSNTIADIEGRKGNETIATPKNIKVPPFSPKFSFTVSGMNCEQSATKCFKAKVEKELNERLKISKE